MRNKVSEIEFHIIQEEVDDFILRAAELIKDGYRMTKMSSDPFTLSYHTIITEPYIHITFRKEEQ